MLTIFANMRINEPERLQHMKDSFMSFKDISDNWLINIRGALRDEAVAFLKENLGDKLTLFELLDDSRGWIENSLEMLFDAKYDYVLFWLEDHVNVAPVIVYSDIVKEMREQHVDYLLYSWWMSGRARAPFDNLADELEMKKLAHIDVLDLTEDGWRKMIANGYKYYILSLLGIYKKSFLVGIMENDRNKLPLFLTKFLFKIMGFMNKIGIRFNTKNGFLLIDKLFFHKLRRYDKECPFDLEKAPTRTDILPFRMALSRQELFACIDDDLDIPGYSLIKRGAYSSAE